LRPYKISEQAGPQNYDPGPKNFSGQPQTNLGLPRNFLQQAERDLDQDAPQQHVPLMACLIPGHAYITNEGIINGQ